MNEMRRRLPAAVAVVSTFLFSGCISSTRSYDAQGRLLGSCEAERAWILGGGRVVCVGSSNPLDQGVEVSTRTSSGGSYVCPPHREFIEGRCRLKSGY